MLDEEDPSPFSNFQQLMLLKNLPACVLDSLTLVLIYAVTVSPVLIPSSNSVCSLKKSTANQPLNSLSVISSNTTVCFTSPFAPTSSLGLINLMTPVYCIFYK